MKIPRRLQSWSFQSTLPRRERHLAFRVRDCLLMFQSTLPRRERLSSLQVSELPAVFNPRSHEGSDEHHTAAHQRGMVSIHAPTKGATASFACSISPHHVSIHAPTKGATQHNELYQSGLPVSIHAPTKGATGLMASEGGQREVSIHAPTKGATGTIQSNESIPRSCFNPRSHEGSDLCSEVLPAADPMFQSTLPRRERPLRYLFFYAIYNVFNPRSHEGSDYVRYLCNLDYEVSIHAPTKGATAMIIRSLILQKSFNPRSHEGSDVSAVRG